MSPAKSHSKGPGGITGKIGRGHQLIAAEAVFIGRLVLSWLGERFYLG
jgi:hypothetical protein